MAKDWAWALLPERWAHDEVNRSGRALTARVMLLAGFVTDGLVTRETQALDWRERAWVRASSLSTRSVALLVGAPGVGPGKD